MRWSLVLSVAMLAVFVVAPTVEVRGEAPQRWAVVKADVTFYDGDRAWVLSDGGPAIVRVLGQSGERVRVRLGDWEEHCVSAQPVDGWWGVRLEVAADDLTPVVTTPTRQTFADGSGVTLLPGTPAADVVNIGPLRVPVSIPADAIGLTYPAPATPPEGGGVAVQVTGTIRLDGSPLDKATSRDGVLDGRLRDDGTAVVSSSCGTVWGPVEGQTKEVSYLSSFGEGEFPGDRWPIGAALTWPDGRPAGELLWEWVRWRGEGRLTGERVCVELGLRAADGGGPMEVCLDLAARSFIQPASPADGDSRPPEPK